MSTDSSPNQISHFYEFLGRRLQRGGQGLTPEESVEEFHLYQQELDRFVRESQHAVEQSEQGNTRPLDIDALMDRVANRLNASESRD